MWRTLNSRTYRNSGKYSVVLGVPGCSAFSFPRIGSDSKHEKTIKVKLQILALYVPQ